MNRINDTCFQALKQNILFQDFSGAEVKQICSTYHMGTKKYEKGAVLFFRGDEYTELCIICQGSVSAEIQDLNGKILKIESLHAPDLIASGILFAEDNHLPVTVTAQSEVEIIKISKPVLLSICQKHQKFLLNLLKDSGKKIGLLSEKLRLVQFSTIRQKISGYLLDQAARQRSDRVRLVYSKEVLSEIFGVTRPALSRVFSELVREGVLSQEGRTVTIENRASLEACLDEDDEDF